MKALNFFTNKTLINYVEDELEIAGWIIRAESAQERLDKIKNSNRFQNLKQKAKESNINAHDFEIVSWLDTLNIMYYAFDEIGNNQLKNQIRIIQEYCIPFSNKRADYILIFENNIIIIEFSYDKFSNEYKFENKLNQAIGYKEQLSNLLPKEINIATYTFIINPETDSNGNVIKKNDYVIPNMQKIKDLADYIEFFFTKHRKNAYYLLQEIDNEN